MEQDVQTRQQAWIEYKPKEAEASNTDVMPTNAAAKLPDKGSKTVIPKTGGVNPRVDVHGQEAPVEVMPKVATHYALPSLPRYPLDSYGEVESAVDYFQKWGSQFVPEHRREFCVNLVKRASVLGVPMDDQIEKYGSATYAPIPEIRIALDGRRSLVGEEAQVVLSKFADKIGTTPPDVFAEALSGFDKVAEIDHLYDSDIMDPFLSTFGKAAEDEGSHILGNDIVSNEQLKNLAKTQCQGIEKSFGSDVVKEFKKDPVGIFKSLPMDQKKILSRMANEAEIL